MNFDVKSFIKNSSLYPIAKFCFVTLLSLRSAVGSLKYIAHFKLTSALRFIVCGNSQTVYNFETVYGFSYISPCNAAGVLLSALEYKSLLNNHTHKPLGIFLDIGAHIGIPSLLFSKLFNRVVAVEASPENYAMLCKNLSNSKNAVVKNLACSNTSTGKSVFYFGNSSTTGSLVNDACGQLRTNGIEIDNISLEDLILQNSVNCNEYNVLKIDVEGSEHGFLYATPRELLKLFDCVIMESHQTGDFDKQIPVDFFRELGFEIKIFSQNKNIIEFAAYRGGA